MKSNFILEKLLVRIGDTAVEVGINNLLRIRYYEDITRASVNVEITISDSQDGRMSEVFGMESVYLQFSDNKTNNSTRTQLNLIVYEVKNREIIDGKQMKVTLCCCNPDITNSAGILVSQQYEDTNITDIVRSLLSKALKTQIPLAYSDKSNNNITFLTNYWNPIQIIQWLSDKAIYSKKSGKSATAGFLFFQNKEGYNWRAMDSLVVQDPLYELSTGVDLSEQEREEGRKIEITNFLSKETSNVLQGLNYGSYSSRVTVFDVGTQKVQDFDFNGYNLYNNIPRLNQSTLPDSYSNMEKKPSRIMTKVINSKLFNAGEYTKDIPKILSQSSFRNKMFFNKQVEAEFIGDHTINVGDVVLVQNYVGPQRTLDPVNSGKYIVGKILREYTTTEDSMRTRLTLYNDSPGTGQDTVNPISSLLQ